MASGSEGVQELQDMEAAGFSPEEINSYRSATVKEMSDSGFSSTEIKEYFGEKEMDTTPIKELVTANLEKAKAANPTPQNPEMADTFLKSVEAGLEMSVEGLKARRQMPNTVLPEHAPMFHKIAFQLGELIGDVPTMAVGAWAGAEVGGAAGATTGAIVGSLAGPGGLLVGGAAGGTVGAVVGGGAGGMALPAAMRKILIDKYEKGEVKDFEDFWARTSATMIDAGKAAVVGGATAGVGGAVGGAINKPVVRTVSQLTSEIATMTTVGKALEGETPKFSDFAEAAVLVGGLHAVGATYQYRGEMAIKAEQQTFLEKKFANIWAKTGVKPADIAIEAQNNPALRQELLSSNIEIPKQYENLVLPNDRTQYLTPKVDPLLAGDSQLKIIKEQLPKAEDGVSSQSTKPKTVETPSTPEEAVLSRIASEMPEGASKKSIGKHLLDTYENFVDDLDPARHFIKQLVEGKDLKTAKDAYQLMRLTRGSAGIARRMIEHDTVDYNTGKVVGPGLRKILEPIGADREMFEGYLVAKQAIEMAGQGKESGVPLEAAKTFVEKNGAKFEKAQKQFVEWQNQSLKYLKDSGRISNEAYNAMLEANKNYAPMHRLFQEGEQTGSGKTSATGKPVKNRKGSERQILSPIESAIKNTIEYTRLAEQNRAMQALADLAVNNPNAAEADSLFVKQKPKLKPINIKSEEVAQFFKEHDIEADPEAFTVFRHQDMGLRSDEIPVFRDGKVEIYKTTPEMARAFRAMDGDRASVNMAVKILKMPASILRASLGLTPDFIARNFFRDQLTAGVFSKTGNPVAHFLDTLTAIGDIKNERQPYQEFLSSGGANAAMIEIDRNYLDKNIFKLNKETGFLDKITNIVKSPIESMRVGSELIENATRLAEYKRVAGENPTKATQLEAGFAAREITLDFARMGAKVRAWNMITAFMNVGIQGVDKTARAIKADPAGVTARALTTITLPSVLLYFSNRKDPRWKDIPDYQKDTCWIVMTKDHIYKFPKPQELGMIFGTAPERMLDAYFEKNPNALKKFEESMANMMTPNMVPTAMSPAVEQFMNRSLFTDHNLVPSQQEGLFSDLQYTEYTSETAKLLAGVIGHIPGMRDIGAQNGPKLDSPIIVDNYLKAWTGTLGTYALQVSDKALVASGLVPDPVKPTSSLADIPFVKAFVIRYPSSSSQQIQDFYDHYAASEKLFSSIKYAAKNGEFDTAQKYAQSQEYEQDRIKLSGIKEGLSKQSKIIHNVYKNPNMSPDEKRQIIDTTYAQMIQIAAFGNKMVEEHRKSLEKKNP